MGIAIIIPEVSFADANLGKVTMTGDVPVQGLRINAKGSYIGTEAQLSVSYLPITTTQRGVTWSIESGSEYASIVASTGLLHIKSGASLSDVVVKVVSESDPQVNATKEIKVSYNGGEAKTLFTYLDCTKDNIVLRDYGGEEINTEYISSDFIEIGNARTIEYCFCFPNMATFCGFNVYNSSKEKVGGSDRGIGNYEEPATYQVQSGDKYFRFTVGMNKNNARYAEALEKCYVRLIM